MRFLIRFLIFGAIFTSIFAADPELEAAFESNFEGGFANSDFIERVVNFAIFAVILYFLLAKRLKNFLNLRALGISERLNEIQNRLKTAKSNKENALKRLHAAKENAAEIILNAKREIYILSKKIEDESSQSIQNMIKNAETSMDFAKKRTRKEVIAEILDEIFRETHINSQSYEKILEKMLDPKGEK